MKKWTAVTLVSALLVTGCEESFKGASRGLDGDAPVNSDDGVERNVERSDVADEPGEVRLLPILTGRSVPIPEVDGMTVVWARSRDAGAEASLNEAEIGEPFEVRLEVTGGGSIDRVEWYIDGVLFRDDDISPPYNLRYFGLLPIEGIFGSDQGFESSWTFRRGQSYTIHAVVHRGERSATVEADFTIAAVTVPPATTTTAPLAGDLSVPPHGIPAGFPTTATTGFAAAGLTVGDLVSSGSIDVRHDGAVIEGLDVNGRIRVFADNVIIRNSRVRSSSAYGIDVQGGSTGLVVENTSIEGTADSSTASIGPGNYTCRRCDISGAVDGAKLGSNVTIEDSYIHDLRKYSGTHNDGIQNSGGGIDILIKGNTIIGPYRTSTSAIIAQTNVGGIDNMVVTENYLYGGSYTVYLRDKGNGNGPPTNSAVTNNVFAGSTSGVFAACLNNSGDAAGCNSKGNTVSISETVAWAGNRFHDGTPF